jgi:hypothetical protein
MLGNTLSDADDERDLGLESLLDTGGGNGGRDEEGGRSGASLLDGFRHILEDGEVEMSRASLLGVRSTNDLGSY